MSNNDCSWDTAVSCLSRLPRSDSHCSRWLEIICRRSVSTSPPELLNQILPAIEKGEVVGRLTLSFKEGALGDAFPFVLTRDANLTSPIARPTSSMRRLCYFKIVVLFF